jgi:uncharacterized surface protein with fasciclin (FAS1) repeats
MSFGNILMTQTRKSFFAVAVIAAMVSCFVSCTETIDSSSRYVFKDITIADYLQKHEQYSEYVRLLTQVPVSRISETTLIQLLSARGNYTVFAPTNDAIQLYLDTLWRKGIITEPSGDGFHSERARDSIEKVVVYNSILDGGDNTQVYTYDFPIQQDGEISLPNMYDRRLSVHLSDDSLDLYLINNEPMDVRNHDIPAINGVIHIMNGVVAPSNNTLGHWMFDNIDQGREGFHVASMLTLAVGLRDTLDMYQDQVYEDMYLRGDIKVNTTEYELEGHNFHTPEHRYYGYTYFAETDSLWSALLGKAPLDITVEDVVKYLEDNNIYPEAKRNQDYEDKDNLLNRFVTYHFLPERLSTDRLVHHYNEVGYVPNTGTLSVAMAEYYTTMGHRRLLKIYESRESNGIYLNRFPILNNGRRGNYHEVGCTPENEGILIGAPNMEGENSVRNGMLYPIGKLLIYDEHTRNELVKGRIRWDVTAMMPEFINNGIRMSPISDVPHENVRIPVTSEYRYLDDVDISDDTQFFYWTGLNRGWKNYDGDEFTIRGLQDVTFRLPPVPKRGTYEIRYAVMNTGKRRGIVQFYWGKDKSNMAVQGIPLDLRIGPTMVNTTTLSFPSFMGWEADTGDEDYDAEVDKQLRNKGFMKGAAIHCAGAPGSSVTGRSSNENSRRIIVRQTMDPDETYYIRFKTVMDDITLYLYMDYLEYCAKEVYDNPEKPEDIW